MGKRRVVGRIDGKKYSWKDHETEKNTRTQFKKNSEQAQLVYVKNIHRNIPTTWGWARGDKKKKKQIGSEKNWTRAQPNVKVLSPRREKERELIWLSG